MKRINITCPACGSKAYLRPASVVYGDKAPDPDAKYYVCGRYPACDCYVAAHRKTMLPMGTLADKALRKKRHDAHVALDSLWKNGIMSRKEAYRLLQLSMGLPAEDAHIAKFSAARCDEVIALSRRFRAAADKAAYRSPLDLLFQALEEEQPNHVAVKQYKVFKQAAGVVCSKRLLNQAVGKSLRTHNLKSKKGA